MQNRVLSRRQFLKASLLAGAGVVALGQGVALAAPAGRRPAFPTFQASKPLAQGMIGGPASDAFPGAERYQYPEDSTEGRAILGIKALKAAGKAPDKIRVQYWDGAIGQWEVPFPEESKVSVKQVWEEETGITIEFIPAAPDQTFNKMMQDITTKAGGYDLYVPGLDNVGTTAETGGIVMLDDFVEKYKPQWADPQWGYVGGQPMVTFLNGYAGHYWVVNTDGDAQVWVYRKDLFEDPKEQADFKAKYGWDLQWPETFEQLDQISEFFHRPDQGLIGVSDLRNSFWSLTNWYQRYASMAAPNAYYFDDTTGKPLINSPAGIEATRQFANALKWHAKDALSWGWPEQYANMGAGGTAITCAFSNMTKFLDTPKNPDSKVAGKLASGLPLGHVVNGKLVRRTVVWPNLNLAVSSQSPYPEAAYLFAQWAGGGRIYSWMAGNPAGYQDPFQEADMRDPNVLASYHEYQVKNIAEGIKRMVPPLKISGATEYALALDTNLQAVMTGQKTPEQAMADTEAEWEKITERIGREKQIAAIKAERAAWPTLVEEPTIKTGTM